MDLRLLAPATPWIAIATANETARLGSEAVNVTAAGCVCSTRRVHQPGPTGESTIPGTRPSAPIAAATPSSALPISAPTRIAQRCRKRKSEDEWRPGDDHEQRDGQVPLQEQRVEEPEHAKPLGNRSDAPPRLRSR